MRMTDPAAAEAPKPYASWVSFVSGLVALGLSLYVLLSGDILLALQTTPKSDPLLLGALVQGIIGTIAGLVALARKEPRRLALLGLGVSVIAVVAKFFLAALAVAIFLAIAIGIVVVLAG